DRSASSLRAASALASTSSVAIAGAVLFLVSDMLIAWNRFVHPRPWAPLAIIVTYHLGQLGLATALRGCLSGYINTHARVGSTAALGGATRRRPLGRLG